MAKSVAYQFGVCGGEADAKYADRQTVSWPDSEHVDANVVFVHGYNMHPSEAWDWSQAMFKRLWWSGMDAGFTAVLWKGNYSQCWLSLAKTYATVNYHQNVFNAFRTARDFSIAMNAIPAERRYFIAHSLGNMLVSEARQYYGLEYDKYIMLNAAVPVEAYDPAGTNEMSKFCMTPPEWRPYAERVRSTHWHDLFEPGDARSKLTWNGHFDRVDKTVNFYSSKDEVVADGDGGAKWLFARDFAWYNQEREKGATLVSASPEAGWIFSSQYCYPETTVDPVHGAVTKGAPWEPQRMNAISSDVLKTTPVFRMFRCSEVCGDDADTFLRINKSVGWHILSHGIPTESFAAGANPVPKWNINTHGGKESQKRDVQNSNSARNIDMETGCGDHTGKWKHSYFIQRSLFDTGGLFDKIVKEMD